MSVESTCFLSYAREDHSAARMLCDQLATAGADIWFDEDRLRPGERWQAAIRKGMRSSRYFLALLSSRAVSKKGFVQKEIREALDLLAEYPDDEIYLIPIRLDECAPSHDRLRELNWVDLFPKWDEGVSKLTRFLRLQTTPLVRPKNMLLNLAEPESYVLLRFDGMYQSGKISGDHAEYWDYARFYEDGAVLQFASTGDDVNIMAEWLDRNKRGYYAKGSFTLTGRKIRFSTKSQTGTVEYDGEVQGERIVLNVYSHINQNRGVRELQFREVPSLRPTANQ